ncbi:MAG: aldehyde dehydrogenase family protein [Phycisphaerales bacterium]|nr:aldehyde dehydrogenase family protein [Phycisphaerae bacterium]NNF43340.1 aldehyde dehydrogenase family protein [Phycisphaerales bacterium]NNM27032.1 aldehyde dehydrogenase family protein [Phycisphaerales bacterium]
MKNHVLDAIDLFADPRVTDAGAAGADCVVSENPATGEPLAAVRLQSRADYDAQVQRCQAVQVYWRQLPAPKRGEIVRRIGNAFRDQLDPLGELVTLEMGKIKPEGLGEVQECIDIADFAVGLSRQLYGLTMHSERAQHRMYEQWHPIGTMGIITAFNFPVAVWAWNAMLAAVCGDAMIWKPSLLTPLNAIAMTNVAHRVMREQDLFQPPGCDPCDVFGLVIGTDDEVGETMIADRRLPLISATGSCRMGRHVGAKVAERLGRSLLELGGNNAIIVMPDADLELVVRGVVFGAVGTAGQRCTTTRRLLCHRDIVETVTERLVAAYKTVPIGDPLDGGTLMGPLINQGAVDAMQAALEQASAEGCTVLCGGLDGIGRFRDQPGHFVAPTIVRVPRGARPRIVRDETFAPILYVFEFDELEQAIEIHNDVDQGLSSAIFTDSVRSAERFLSHGGSDCGIANVNIGTSGAEIGGAFGGEKDTGGGRESGSDAWKAYMRRQTCTINWGDDLPLAQGIEFG